MYNSSSLFPLGTQPACKSRHPLAQPGNAIVMAFCWWADSDPILYADWEAMHARFKIGFNSFR